MKKLLAVLALSLFAIAVQAMPVNFNSILNTGNGMNNTVSGFPGPFGTVNVLLTSLTTATITFTGENGFQFGDGGAVAVQLNASSFTVSVNGSDTLFKDVTGGGNEDGFGKFNLEIDNKDFSIGFNSISFKVTNTGGTWTSPSDVLAFNTKGFDAAAHVRESINNPAGLTGFAAENGKSGVPDGGSTAMLFGAALTGLGFLRRLI